MLDRPQIVAHDTPFQRSFDAFGGRVEVERVRLRHPVARDEVAPAASDDDLMPGHAGVARPLISLSVPAAVIVLATWSRP